MLGRRTARLLRPGMVLALQGELGTGKTVLTRGIARGLGIDEPLTSPTFTIAQQYAWRENLWLFHLDMYRIDGAEAAIAFGIDDYLFAPDGITVIEWPERIQDLLRPADEALTAGQAVSRPGAAPPDLYWLRLEHEGPQTRRITVPGELHSQFAAHGDAV